MIRVCDVNRGYLGWKLKRWLAIVLESAIGRTRTMVAKTRRKNPSGKGATMRSKGWLKVVFCWIVIDGCRTDRKQDLAAPSRQRSSQAHFSAPTHGRALRLPRLWHLVSLLSWATAGFLALAFACFPCVGSWDGGMERGCARASARGE